MAVLVVDERQDPGVAGGRGVAIVGAMRRHHRFDEIRDLLELLGGTEALAGEIRALHYEMLAAYARKDRLEYFKANQAIHAAIVAACSNPAIADEHRRINAQLYRERYRSNLRNENRHTALDEHGEILDALEKRDSDKLSKILRAHLGSTWEKVSELAIEKTDSEAALEAH